MKDIWSGSAHLLAYHWTNVCGYDDGGLVEEGTHTNWRLSLTSLMTPAIYTSSLPTDHLFEFVYLFQFQSLYIQSRFGIFCRDSLERWYKILHSINWPNSLDQSWNAYLFAIFQTQWGSLSNKFFSVKRGGVPLNDPKLFRQNKFLQSGGRGVSPPAERNPQNSIWNADRWFSFFVKTMCQDVEIFVVV